MQGLPTEMLDTGVQGNGLTELSFSDSDNDTAYFTSTCLSFYSYTEQYSTIQYSTVQGGQCQFGTMLKYSLSSVPHKNCLLNVFGEVFCWGLVYYFN